MNSRQIANSVWRGMKFYMLRKTGGPDKIALSSTVSEINGDFCKIFPPLVFNVPVRGFPLVFYNDFGL